AVIIVDHLLVERPTQTLHHAAVDLTTHFFRIDRKAHVLSRYILQHLNIAGFLIYLDFRQVDRKAGRLLGLSAGAVAQYRHIAPAKVHGFAGNREQVPPTRRQTLDAGFTINKLNILDCRFEFAGSNLLDLLSGVFRRALDGGADRVEGFAATAGSGVRGGIG